jgi:hypothetical protein
LRRGKGGVLVYRAGASGPLRGLGFNGRTHSGFIPSVSGFHLYLAEINVEVKRNTPRRQAAKV